LLNPLEKEGFIQRLKDPDDRRYVLISLTHKGRRFSESLLAEETEHLDKLVRHLGQENSRMFLRLMSSTINFFSKQPIPDSEPK
jgi:DNA-binding MarR family transcriptional regulator